jgi:hypothetical protein
MVVVCGGGGGAVGVVRAMLRRIDPRARVLHALNARDWGEGQTQRCKSVKRRNANCTKAERANAERLTPREAPNGTRYSQLIPVVTPALHNCGEQSH